MLLLLLMVDFCGQVLDKWPSCLLDQQSGLLTSTTTIICWSLSVSMCEMAWKPSLLRQMFRTKSTYATPSAKCTAATSSALPYALMQAARTSLFSCTRSLLTVTLTCLVPLYSGWRRKCFVETLLLASFAASSSEGSRTSQVAKFRQQKYWHGMAADFKSSLKVSYLIPTNLLILKSVIIVQFQPPILEWEVSPFLWSREHTSRLCSFHTTVWKGQTSF